MKSWKSFWPVFPLELLHLWLDLSLKPGWLVYFEMLLWKNLPQLQNHVPKGQGGKSELYKSKTLHCEFQFSLNQQILLLHNQPPQSWAQFSFQPSLLEHELSFCEWVPAHLEANRDIWEHGLGAVGKDDHPLLLNFVAPRFNYGVVPGTIHTFP